MTNMKFSTAKTACHGFEKSGPPRSRRVQMKKANGTFRVFDFRQRVLLCSVLASVVMLYAGSVLILEAPVVGHSYKQIPATPAIQAPESDRPHSGTAVTRVLFKQLQTRPITILGFIFVCFLTLSYLSMRRISGPLHELSEAARRVAEGRLQVRVPARGSDAVGKIGQAINDLSTNLQEILLHVWNHAEQDMVLLDRIAAALHSEAAPRFSPEIIRNFELVRQDIKNMQMMVEAFEYYDVRLDDDKVMAGKESRPQPAKGEHHE